jgi:hypothetical protein
MGLEGSMDVEMGIDRRQRGGPSGNGRVQCNKVSDAVPGSE